MSKAISNEEFKNIYENDENIHVLDVREDFEYEIGHIPGSESKPLSTFPIDDLDKDKTYYVLCQSGGRSEMACEFLSQQGYDVINVAGGMSSWQGDIE